MDGDLQQVIYQPRHDFILDYDVKFFNASFANSEFRKTLQRKVPGLWAADIFTPKYCQLLLEEVGRMHETTGGKCLDSNGLPLLAFGFKPFFEEFTRQFEKSFIRPIYAHHVLELKTAFITGHDETSKRYHPIHEDDSSISVSVCLGKDFSGGEFCIPKHPVALRQALARAKEVNLYGECAKLDTGVLSKEVFEFVKQEPFRALIYQGRNLHGTAAVNSGSRMNLVIWMTLHKPFPLFLQLPVELQSVVVSQLPVSDILNLTRVSKSIQALCDADDVWEAVIARHGFTSTSGLDSPPSTAECDMMSFSDLQKLSAKQRFRRLMRQSSSVILRRVLSQYYSRIIFQRAPRPGDPRVRLNLDAYARDPALASVVQTEVANVLAKCSYGQIFQGKVYVPKAPVKGVVVVVNRGEKTEATSATATRPVSARRPVAVSKPLTSKPYVPVSSSRPVPTAPTSSRPLSASLAPKLKPVAKPVSQAKPVIPATIPSSKAVSQSLPPAKLTTAKKTVSVSTSVAVQTKGDDMDDFSDNDMPS